ncbi:MAG: hypothetical protein KC680_03855 [Candidatus Peregrinibacteria bacterium]|nr:hypothetical protein [Candidatus Peregrinibacteria bacterium]
MIIKIDYDEFEKSPKAYRGVELRWADRKHRYATGDVVKDFKKAVEKSKVLPGLCFFSSTVDSFLYDLHEWYVWDDRRNLIEKRE